MIFTVKNCTTIGFLSLHATQFILHVL